MKIHTFIHPRPPPPKERIILQFPEVPENQPLLAYPRLATLLARHAVSTTIRSETTFRFDHSTYSKRHIRFYLTAGMKPTFTTVPLARWTLMLAYDATNRAWQQSTEVLHCVRVCRVLAFTGRHTHMFNMGLVTFKILRDRAISSQTRVPSPLLLSGWHWQQTHIFRVLCVFLFFLFFCFPFFLPWRLANDIL